MISVVKKLHEKITQSGAISIADYMAETAQHYYASRDPFGTEGDFITAPEISQMFGEMIGLWCAQIWQQSGGGGRGGGGGGGAPSILAELGPGRGTLMADIIRTGRVMPGFVEAQTIYFVEQSARLKQMQKKSVPQALPVSAFSDLPSGFLLLIANEFLDALPIRQFKRTDSGWRENCIGIKNDRLIFTLSDQEIDVELPDAPIGTIAEICPQAEALVASIAQRISQTGGAALLIDYGDDQTIFGDTLQAVSGHQSCSVLDKTGEADMTAHVRFGRLAEIARAQGAHVPDIISQAKFLKNFGISARAKALCEKASTDDQHDIIMAFKRLTAPNQMGALFKVMMILPSGKNNDDDSP